MFKWLHNLFCCECKSAKQVATQYSKDAVTIGVKYCPRIYYQNPFERQRYSVVVKDIKEGWVLFTLLSSGVRDSVSIRDFEYCFIKVGEGEQKC